LERNQQQVVGTEQKQWVGQSPIPKLWNANYCKVMSANLMLYFSFYLLTPLLPLYLSEEFGATKDMIGLVLMGYTITATLTRPLSGFLVDSYPRKKVLLWCFFLFFIFFGGYLAAGTLLMFAIIRTLHGAPFGALTVANSTVAIDVLAPSRRTEGIGLYGLSNNIAMAVAPTVGLFVYNQTNNFTLLFWIAFAIALVGLIIDSTVTLRDRELVKKQTKTFPRPFLPCAWLAVGGQYVVFRVLFRCIEQLSCDIWTRRTWHHRRHGNVFYGLVGRSCGVTVAGQKVVARGQTFQKRIGGHHLVHDWLHGVCSRQK